MKKKFVHILIWLILTYFLFASFSLFLPLPLAILRAVSGILLMAGMFYIAGWFIASKLLIEQRKPILFILISFLICVLFSVLRTEIFNLFPENVPSFAGQFPRELIRPLNEKIDSPNRPILQFLLTREVSYVPGIIFNAVVLIIAVLLRLYEYRGQKELESREALQRNQEAQIQYLKSQVNPHFLFNTLNNLYGLTYSRSELAPEMVLGLSDTMRYMIYETEQKWVPVRKEMDFIRNYLGLEKMRISESENILIRIEVSNEGSLIPPLLLLPFVENCFKHGTIGKDDEGWMELDIWDEKNRLYFVCKNSYKPSFKDERGTSGVGIPNVRKRLELLFGRDFDLKIVKSDDEYMVSLGVETLYQKER